MMLSKRYEITVLASKVEDSFEDLAKKIRGGGVKQVFHGAS
jgi:hypothetical protein